MSETLIHCSLRRKSTCAQLVLLLLLLPLGGRAASAAMKPADLLAHGDEQWLWVGHVHQIASAPSSLQTTIYFRTIGQEMKWRVLTSPPLQGRVVSLASQGPQAAALLDDGTWMLLYADNGPFTAGPLPAPARMVALAGGRSRWWAVGLTPGGAAAVKARAAATTRPAAGSSAGLPGNASQPATMEPTGAAPPATAPLAASLSTGNRLVLFSLVGNAWTIEGELPDEVPPAPSVSLALIDDTPWVAGVDLGGTLRIEHLLHGQWIAEPPVELPPFAHFKLFNDSTIPRLLVEPQDGPDLLYAFGPHRPAPIRLPPIADSAADQRAVCIATGSIRMIARVKDKFVEQDFKVDSGGADGPPYTLALPESSPLSTLRNLQYLVVMIALLVAMLGSYRQRGQVRESGAQLEAIVLAPLGRRLAAGIIDALPVILALAIMAFRLSPAKGNLDQTSATLMLLVYWAGGLFYVIYTTLIESLTGRSLGKVAMGLRVIGLDAQPAKPGALVTRNALRLIDVGVFFLPLLSIPFMPYRQRAGDMAAGTIVVLDTGAAPTDKDPDGAKVSDK